MKNDKEIHIDIYESRHELYQEGRVSVYQEGVQNSHAQNRYRKIKDTLDKGFLSDMINSVDETDFSKLSNENKKLIQNLVEGVTSEVGRALVCVAFLQMTIKSICPEQSIRLHKGGTRSGSFSWKDGISMRTLDKHYNTPFLREHNLLKMNKDGAFMTRCLAENYPYSKLYKAEMRGPFCEWIEIVDALENGSMPPNLALRYITALLRNSSEKFIQFADKVVDEAKKTANITLLKVQNTMVSFFNTTSYSARAFEVVIHGLMQAMQECDLLDDLRVVPLSQMRTANKKHGNIGDIELKRGNVVVESWDAKYGKPYLRDELEELRDKIPNSPGVEIAGFITDDIADKRPDVMVRVEDIQQEMNISIQILSFDEWVCYQTDSLDKSTKNILAKKWLIAVVESFAQKRPLLAPIDEPCDEWLHDLARILQLDVKL